MKKIKVQELSPEAFAPYGSYVNLLKPEGEVFGALPIAFYRDMLPAQMGVDVSISFSVCAVSPRERVVDIIEYHSKTCEGNLPLDMDVLVHVGPATANGVLPDRIEVFRIPKGTLFVLRPGVWHHAPFATGDGVSNNLVVLPERTYANDCIVETLTGDARYLIEE